MPEIIDCPSCHRKLQAPESLDGQDVQCPGCGSTFRARIGLNSVQIEPPARPPAPPRLRGEPPADDYGLDDPRGGPEGWRSLPRDAAGLGRALPHRGAAVLTLGILALVGLIICIPALVLGPIAWVMGSTDLGLIRAGRMDRTGEGMTAAGQTCGIIATVVGGIGLVLACLGMMKA